MEKKLSNKRLKVHPEIRQLAFDIKSSIKPPTEEGASVRLGFLLGAGASIQSLVPGTIDMIRHFKNELFKRYGVEFETEDKGDEWIDRQPWSDKNLSEYGRLFEKCYPTEGKRRSYIESLIDGKQPSVGYIILANLIKLGHIKTIITTNFDSLISLACSNYTNILPVVYSSGNFASEMTVSSERPRVLKIHGDFLYSRSLKNLDPELTHQDTNMKKQVQRILEEYDGLVVVGYSGKDNSVMDLIEQIPDGKTLYWCDLHIDRISERARKTITAKNGTFVQIEGFDELMHIVRFLIDVNDEIILGSFKDRQIAINEKLEAFANVTLIDDSTQYQINSKSSTDFGKLFRNSLEVIKLFSEGEQARKKEDHVLAEELFRKIITIEPTYAKAHYSLGRLLSSEEWNDESRRLDAEKHFRAAIDLDPEFMQSYASLGYLLSSDDTRKEEAEEYLRKALRLQPHRAQTYNSLAYLLAKDDSRKEEAETLFHKAIELDRDYAQAYNGLGRLLLTSDGRSHEAEKYFRKAIELHPENSKAYDSLGYLLFKNNRLKEAEECLRKALELEPNSYTYNILGNLLVEEGTRLDEAEIFYRKAIDMDRVVFTVYDNLCKLLRSNGNIPDTFKICEIALNRKNDAAVILLHVAGLYRQTGNTAKSLEFAELAKQHLQNEDFYNFARYFSIVNQKDKAIESLKVAIDRKPFRTSWAKREKDFDWIRNDFRFREMVGMAKPPKDHQKNGKNWYRKGPHAKSHTK